MQLPNEDDQQDSNTGIDTTEEARLSIADLPAITITHVNKPTEEEDEPAVPVTSAASAVFSQEDDAHSTEPPLVAEDGNRQSQESTRIREDSDKDITHAMHTSASYEHDSNLKEAVDLPESFDFSSQSATESQESRACPDQLASEHRADEEGEPQFLNSDDAPPPLPIRDVSPPLPTRDLSASPSPKLSARILSYSPALKERPPPTSPSVSAEVLNEIERENNNEETTTTSQEICVIQDSQPTFSERPIGSSSPVVPSSELSELNEEEEDEGTTFEVVHLGMERDQIESDKAVQLHNQRSEGIEDDSVEIAKSAAKEAVQESPSKDQLHSPPKPSESPAPAGIPSGHADAFEQDLVQPETIIAECAERTTVPLEEGNTELPKDNAADSDMQGVTSKPDGTIGMAAVGVEKPLSGDISETSPGRDMQPVIQRIEGTSGGISTFQVVASANQVVGEEDKHASTSEQNRTAIVMEVDGTVQSEPDDADLPSKVSMDGSVLSSQDKEGAKSTGLSAMRNLDNSNTREDRTMPAGDEEATSVQKVMLEEVHGPPEETMGQRDIVAEKSRMQAHTMPPGSPAEADMENAINLADQAGPVSSERVVRPPHGAEVSDKTTGASEISGSENSQASEARTSIPIEETGSAKISSTTVPVTVENDEPSHVADDQPETASTANVDTPSKSTSSTIPTTSTPSTLPRLHRNSTKGQTYVGGMLASNKAMKPFRSPMIARKDSTSGADNGASTSTPSKSTATNGTKSLLGRPSILAASTSSPGSVSSPVTTSRPTPRPSSFAPVKKPSTPANAALNKAFKSLFGRTSQTGNGENSAQLTIDMLDTDGNPMSSIQLAAALPKLERRLALLKDAKRHRIASEKGLESADNTEHIKELSLKWLEKGREAAEMLYELVKDSMNTHGDAQNGDSGFGYGFEQDKSNNGGGNWGWDTSDPQAQVSAGRRRRKGGSSWKETGSVDRLRQQVSDAIDSLPEEERKALYQELEEEGDDLPDLDPEEAMARLRKKRASSSTYDKQPKRARRDNNDEEVEHDTDKESCDEEHERKLIDDREDLEDNDALSDTAHDEEETAVRSEEDEGDMEVDDDPTKRGLAKLLIQCGIDTKTLGWDPANEEWELLS